MVNQVILIGRLGDNPEVRYLPDGKMVVNFRMATDESYKNKQGEKVSKAEWHRIVVFGKLAEICGNYLTKGKLVFIEGKLQTREWENRDGVKQYTTEIVADQMKMLDGAPSQAKTENANAQLPDEDVPF